VLAALVVTTATGAAAAIGALLAGRGLPGLGLALAVVAAGCLALLADRRARAALGAVRSQLKPAPTRENAS
jgi:hypothetical protein